jgi:hypothetical protein
MIKETEATETIVTKDSVVETIGTRRSRMTTIKVSRLEMSDQLSILSTRTTSKMKDKENGRQPQENQMNLPNLPPILLRARRSGDRNELYASTVL